MPSTQPFPDFSSLSLSENPQKSKSQRKSKRTTRRALQELPLSSGGNIAGYRQETWRPVPSIDAENIRAILHSLKRRQGVLERHGKRLIRDPNVLKAYRHHLQDVVDRLVLTWPQLE
ncbi:hypothetical protein PT974_02613 [Cladobotryum mycophilum]|uniref:Uncharacterized protein n=1 Tax=Cladobotryum mycophilum TaxID=491253 RepID=A0ABR0SYJ9_9HYPO